MAKDLRTYLSKRRMRLPRPIPAGAAAPQIEQLHEENRWRKKTSPPTVTLLGILPGDPPRILTSKRVRRDGKPGRLFQQMVLVPDTGMFARLVAQVHRGETITVTVTTEWHANGYRTYLSAFVSPVSPAAAEPEQARL